VSRSNSRRIQRYVTLRYVTADINHYKSNTFIQTAQWETNYFNMKCEQRNYISDKSRGKILKKCVSVFELHDIWVWKSPGITKFALADHLEFEKSWVLICPMTGCAGYSIGFVFQSAKTKMLVKLLKSFDRRLISGAHNYPINVTSVQHTHACRLAASVVYWSEFLNTDSEVRVRFPALPHFLSGSGSWAGSTQPRQYNWGATWKKK
jgi:hypothetical protein